MIDPKHMPEDLHNALGIVLAEFGWCDLPERLKYYRGEDMDTEADELEAAFSLVNEWYSQLDVPEIWRRHVLTDTEDARRATTAATPST
jgi:hypothetical protein